MRDPAPGIRPRVLSTHLLRLPAERRGAELQLLQRAAAGSFHTMPDRLSEDILGDDGVGVDDAIRVVRRGGALRRYAVLAEPRGSRGAAARSRVASGDRARTRTT